MGIKFHFLNVGDGDCTIVDFPKRKVTSTGQSKDARTMMVDIHHHAEVNDNNYESVIDYYKDNFLGRPIFRFIATHPHKDHLKGIKALFNDNSIQILNFWDLEHEFKPKEEGEDWEDYKDDWEKYCEVRQMKDSQLCVRRYWDHNKNIKYWDEDRIEILSPSRDLHYGAHHKEDGSKKEHHEIDLNNMPYVLLVKVNNRKILLASDAENACWDYILENHDGKIRDIDIFKAAHHGHESGLHEEVLKVMNPKFVVFSNSSERDGEYGVQERYEEIIPGVIVYKTCDLGTIIADVPFEESEDISFQKT